MKEMVAGTQSLTSLLATALPDAAVALVVAAWAVVVVSCGRPWGPATTMMRATHVPYGPVVQVWGELRGGQALGVL